MFYENAWQMHVVYFFLSGLLPFKEKCKEHFLFGVYMNLTALEREERGIRFPCSPSKAPEQSLEHCVKCHAFSMSPPWLLPAHHVCT